MAIDVLFVHPGNLKGTYQDLAAEFTAIDAPVWATLLCSYLRQHGITCAVYDVNLDGWSPARTAEILARHAPRVVVVMVYGHHPSASTQTMPAARAIAADLKAADSDLPVAFGGTHPASLPVRTLEEESVDFVIAGEGPKTVRGLALHYRGDCQLDEIPGLWHAFDGAPRFTGAASVVQDLDAAFPDYAWDALDDLRRYRAHNWHCFQDFEQSTAPNFCDVRSPYVSLYTSLGCPFSCSYCCINAIFGKPGIRYWSVDRVVSWLDVLVREYGVRNVRLADELFVLARDRVARFCDLIAARGHELNIWAYARVDTIDLRLLSKMKRAGINWLCLGIESGNTAVRAGVNKRIVGDIEGVVRRIQDSGIHVLGNYMFGLPDDSLGTMQETLDLALRLNCEFSNFYTVMAYPGSALYTQQAAAGTVSDNWSAFSQHSYETQPLPTRYLSPAKVLRFRDEAFNIYFGSGTYQTMVERKFGPKVRAHIQKMLSVQLRRRLLA